MLGQMHGPTVVCHSCRFRSFQYLFPLNVFSSPRFPPLTTSSYTRAYISLSFYSVTSTLVLSLSLSLSHCPFLAPTSLAEPSLDQLFFSSSSRNYSFHCCMHIRIRYIDVYSAAWGYFFLRCPASVRSFLEEGFLCEKCEFYCLYLRYCEIEDDCISLDVNLRWGGKIHCISRKIIHVTYVDVIPRRRSLYVVSVLTNL